MAESDLEGLRSLAQQQVAYPMCRSKLAEVVEKIMKAELIRSGWFLERTHDLEKLLGELQVRKSDLAAQFEPLCDALTEAYFIDRYPGFDLDDPDWPRLREQLERASQLLLIVKTRVRPISF